MADQDTQIIRAIEFMKHDSHFNLEKTVLNIVGEKAFSKVVKAFLNDFSLAHQLSDASMSQQEKKAFCHKLKSAAGNVGAANLAMYTTETDAELINDNVDVSFILIELNSVISLLNQHFGVIDN